mmetsp:Transcript_58560/g.171350  ORF Transcript_58560/g.171350 Transcript_58560/m.171350 type:complete len:209 (-) Transcript_58560:658-1284(-)
MTSRGSDSRTGGASCRSPPSACRSTQGARSGTLALSVASSRRNFQSWRSTGVSVTTTKVWQMDVRNVSKWSSDLSSASGSASHMNRGCASRSSRRSREEMQRSTPGGDASPSKKDCWEWMGRGASKPASGSTLVSFEGQGRMPEMLPAGGVMPVSLALPLGVSAFSAPVDFPSKPLKDDSSKERTVDLPTPWAPTQATTVNSEPLSRR